jgi:hypothetical protein
MPINTPVPRDVTDHYALSQTLRDISRRAVDGTVLPLFLDQSGRRVLIGAVVANGNDILQVNGNATVSGLLTAGNVFAGSVAASGSVWARSLTAALLQSGSGVFSGPVLISGPLTVNGNITGQGITGLTFNSLTVNGPANITGLLSAGNMFVGSIAASGSIWATSLTSNGSIQGRSAVIAGRILASDGVNALSTNKGPVDVASANPPANGQVLTATGPNSATWQTPSSGSVTTNSNNAVPVYVPAIVGAVLQELKGGKASNTIVNAGSCGLPRLTQQVFTATGRVANVIYQNKTGNTMFVLISSQGSLAVKCDAVNASTIVLQTSVSGGAVDQLPMMFIVPVSYFYQVTATPTSWTEYF